VLRDSSRQPNLDHHRRGRGGNDDEDSAHDHHLHHGRGHDRDHDHKRHHCVVPKLCCRSNIRRFRHNSNRLGGL
jgi:hypothetical protein